MKKVPKRLNREPLIEVIWQVRFEPKPDTSVGDLLPGVLYSALKTSHPGILLHPLPTVSIPAPVAQLDANLRYAAKYRLEDPESRFLYQVGDRFLTMNCRKPYVGWGRFKDRLLVLMKTLEDSGLVPTPLHHSLRYIDLLTLDPAPDVSALQLVLKIGQQAVVSQPLQLRMEMPDDPFTHVVQIATPAEACLPEGPSKGTIIDLETFNMQPPTDWGAIRAQIDPLHDRSKAIFFQKLLTAEAISKLEPEY